MIFFVEKKSRFVKFCAAQGILLYGGGSVLMILLSIINAFVSPVRFSYYTGISVSPVGIIISVITWIIGIALFAISIYLVIMAAQKKNVRLPVLGNMADKMVK